MSPIVRILCTLAVLCLTTPPAVAGAGAPSLPPNCVLTVKPNAETYLVCLPPVLWNHDLVVFAHGYEFDYPALPPKLGEEQWLIKLSNGTTVNLPELVNALGFGFATTSYSKNGLAVQQGVAEMKALVDSIHSALPGQVRNVYIVGASEGGLVTTLSMERNADTYKGGLALCGPLGDFQKQINYWGDFRAAFDVLFPGLPDDAVSIPTALMADWVTIPSPSQLSIISQLSDPLNTLKVVQLLGLTQAPFDPADTTTIGATTLGILTYNILATNEARVELSKGQVVPVQPYDNTANLPLLAAGAKHYLAVGDVAAALQPYQTTGMLAKSLVTMHNLGDPIVPAWHETLYQTKVALTGSTSKLTVMPINRYGHCIFKPSEILFSFALMLYKANQAPVNVAQYQALLAVESGAFEEFMLLNDQYGDITHVKYFFPVVGR